MVRDIEKKSMAQISTKRVQFSTTLIFRNSKIAFSQIFSKKNPFSNISEIFSSFEKNWHNWAQTLHNSAILSFFENFYSNGRHILVKLFSPLIFRASTKKTEQLSTNLAQFSNTFLFRNSKIAIPTDVTTSFSSLAHKILFKTISNCGRSFKRILQIVEDPLNGFMDSFPKVSLYRRPLAGILFIVDLLMAVGL